MRTLYSVAILLVFSAANAAAQQSAQHNKSQDDLGWTSTMTFEGSANSSERVLDLNSSAGYNFTKNWGADLGVPFTFASSSSSTTTTTGGKNSTSSSLNSIGNIFTDVRFAAKGSALDYNSTLTATAPTGSKKNGISSGRPNVGWNNHLEHGFDLLTPFIEAGFSNGLTDTALFHRPFTTLGFISQFSGGTTLDLGHDFSLGGSLYDVLPAGTQKLYSKLVSKGSTQTAGSGGHGRGWELAAETIGTSALTKDNGGSIWFEYAPRALDMQVGYTHSVHYALNTMAFSLGINLAKLKKVANQ